MPGGLGLLFLGTVAGVLRLIRGAPNREARDRLISLLLEFVVGTDRSTAQVRRIETLLITHFASSERS